MSYPKRLGLKTNYPSMNIYELTRQAQQDSDERRNKTKVLSYRVISYPKNFTEQLVLEITTDLTSSEVFNIIVYDIDSLSLSNEKKPFKDTKIINKKYNAVANKFQLSIPFNESAQANAWKDNEYKMAECYFEISCSKSKAEYSDVFLVEKSKTPSQNAQSEIKVIKKALNLTVEQQRNFMAAVLVETSSGRIALYDIAWIYFNLIQSLGFEKGLSRSSAYYLKEKNYMFKAHLYFLGNGEKYKNDIGTSPSNWDDYTIKDYVNIGSYKNDCKDSVLAFKKFAEKEIFSNKPMTLYDDGKKPDNIIGCKKGNLSQKFLLKDCMMVNILLIFTILKV